MPMIVYMDGGRHKSLRTLLSRVFTPKTAGMDFIGRQDPAAR